MSIFVVIAGSRDNKLALWRVEDTGPPDRDNYPISPDSGTPDGTSVTQSSHIGRQSPVPQYATCKPLQVKECSKADKVRAMAYSDNRMVGE